ncbi:MAG: amino acid permease [Chloroflexi bacterium]|nr:MAG: amino acid permease [Chloroflexota bacterium]
MRAVRRVIIGRPLTTAEGSHERLSKVKALAVFSSDALSSVAYASQEALVILALAGAAALSLVWPISLGVAVLLAIVVASYRQTVAAYPGGGGAYIVAKDNLGTTPSLIAAASLLIAYVLTVAVSVSAATAAITSALPSTFDYRVWISIGAIVLVMLANLRGISESGTIFAIPTYAFILCMFTLIALGLLASLDILIEANPPRYELEDASRDLSIVLVLRAFAAGGAALTGVEAISDGVPAFKEPSAKNAAQTLVWMGLLLGTMFLGISFLARHFHLVPSEEETIVSQLARTLAGESAFYYIVQGFTALILVLAANTAFADFPRLSSFLARDRFLPHQFLFRGDRLAFNTGIIALGVLSILLVIGFDANVTGLIPLYAVGVFASFTFSEAGMTRRWLHTEPSRQRTLGLLLNGVGAVATGIVLIIVAVTRFLDGAWIILVVVPIIILLLRGIHNHYRDVATQLRMTAGDLRSLARPPQRDIAVVVPVDSLNRASARAIEFARSISSDVTAVHIAADAEDGAELQRSWSEAGVKVPLVIIESPYRSLIGPLIAYLEQRRAERGNEFINVVLPEFVPAHLGEHVLHNQSALRLKAALLFQPGIVVTDVPYHLQD